MPVSGDKETGVKPISRQSSDYIAGVPIKKRRFLLYRSPSPPPEEPSALPAENDSLKQEQSSPSQGLAMSNASVVTSSGISDANNKPVSEEYKGRSDVMSVTVAQSNPNYSTVKVEEPSKSHSGSLDDMESKDKLVTAEKSASLVTLGKSKLQSSPSEALALKLGKELYSKEKAEGKCKAEIPIVAGNTDLTLGLKEHVFPALTGHNHNVRGQNQDSLEPGSLNLSLSKGNNSIQCKKDEVESKNGAQQCGNRANWDLNTTMDAWEGSASEAAAVGQVSAGGFNTTDGTHDIKPLLCPTGTIGTVIPSKQKSLVASENIAKLTSSKLPSQQLRFFGVDNLRLGLGPSSLPQQVSPEPSSLSSKEDSGRIFTNIILQRSVVPPGNLIRVNYRTVKSEPVDEGNKLENRTTIATKLGLLDNRTVKRELAEQFSVDKVSNISTMRVVDPASIKMEPVHRGNVEAPNTLEGTSRQVDKQVLLGLSDHSSAMAIPESALLPCPAGETSCSTELTIATDVGNHVEQSTYTKEAHINGEVVPQEACERVQLVASETAAISVGHDGVESSTSCMMGTVRAEDGNADDPEQCRLKSINEQPPDVRGSEGCVSDEEKINISADMLEEDSYGSDYESDGNHPLPKAMDTEQGGEEDYEDGEVREPLLQTAVEDPICEKQEVEHVDHGDSDNNKMDIVGQHGDDHPSSSHVEEKDAKTEDPGETNNKESSDCVDSLKEVYDNGDTNLTCLQESLTDEKPASGADIKRPITAIRRNSLDQSGSTDFPEEQEAELSLERTTEGMQATTSTFTFTQGLDDNVNNFDLVEENDTTLTMMEASASGDDAAKDVNSGGNRSRIINLSRAANVSPPGKTRYISDRPLASLPGRERLLNVPLEGDKFYPRGRDELYIDGSHKFSRERHQDQSPRNSRLNFVRGRGRITGRLDPLRRDWDSDREFASEFYNGPSEFRFPRNKYASAVVDADLEYNSYNIAPDGAFIGTGRGGRKHLDDEGAMFRHMSSRGRSPGGRNGLAARGGPQMIHRGPRMSEDGSEVVGLRHSEKFMSVFPDDNMDPMFTRPQPTYEGVDAHFARGGRNFSSVQRRGLPRIHSKSPMRSRSRSPVQWSSPRRRSQDGFGGHPELPHRRSPIYRVERIRSPDRTCFTGPIMVRRNGSPPYMSRPSNDLRDINSGRDHGHPRSVIPNRSSSGRILYRNRRFDDIDPQERTDGDEFFGGPIHVRHELGVDPNGDERRRFGERRGPVRSFRQPYNGANGENFHLNSEDGPRPFRFCPEDNPEFHERGNLRDREFDRRIKNRPGNAPRRTRSIEEQETNFRQPWHDAGFDEISRVKRKRDFRCEI
ncbi:uncharacterized protein LOC112015838 [Quercus suber]|uniref:uncharacterized protein LOC112015838 n=1 Tax=Quercus suber TaxID=58331 RepID=UPI0032DEF0C2